MINEMIDKRTFEKTIVGINDGYGFAIKCVSFSAFSCNSMPLGSFIHFNTSAYDTFTELAHYFGKK